MGGIQSPRFCLDCTYLPSSSLPCLESILIFSVATPVAGSHECWDMPSDSLPESDSPPNAPKALESSTDDCAPQDRIGCLPLNFKCIHTHARSPAGACTFPIACPLDGMQQFSSTKTNWAMISVPQSSSLEVGEASRNIVDTTDSTPSRETEMKPSGPTILGLRNMTPPST